MVLKGDLGKVKTGSGFASYVWVPSIEEQIESLFWIDVVFVMVTIKQKTYCGQCPASYASNNGLIRLVGLFLKKEGVIKETRSAWEAKGTIRWPYKPNLVSVPCYSEGGIRTI
ncbi:hypothetical protein AB4K20DRAFT_1862971 [Rhizopus microsporus]